MDAEKPAAELREEIRLVAEDIAGLRRTAVQLREHVGADEPGDFADKASAIAAAEEQEALAEQLEARRNDLRVRLTTAR